MKSCAFYLSFIFLTLVFGCQPKVDEDKLFSKFSATCLVYDGYELMACRRYAVASDINSLSCDGEKNRYYNYGASKNRYSTAMDCEYSNIVGTCRIGSDKVYYYGTRFTAGAAQTECNSLSGTLE